MALQEHTPTVVCSHVDDFFWGGLQVFKNHVTCAVLKKFQISHQERAAFTYLGLQMKQLPNAICVQQSSCVSDISPIVIQKGRSKFDKLTDYESHQLRTLAGQLNWVANQTRPDVAFGARQASIAATNRTVNHLQAENKALKKLLSEEVVLNFKNLGDIKKATVSAFSDASHANLKGGPSQGGYIIFLHGENNHVAPISWRSRKINRVVRNTLAAETLALTEAAEQSFYIRAILTELLELHDKKCLPIDAITDNQLLLDSIKSTKTVDDKRLLIDISCIREKLVNSTMYCGLIQKGS